VILIVIGYIVYKTKFKIDAEMLRKLSGKLKERGISVTEHKCRPDPGSGRCGCRDGTGPVDKICNREKNFNDTGIAVTAAVPVFLSVGGGERTDILIFFEGALHSGPPGI
jgi:hypothetical protein